jgi:hypothetical protein
VGFNTTIVIYNDALESIAGDPEFGKNLRNAVLRAISKSDCPVHLSAGTFSAGVVVETHHADERVLVSVGENTGIVIKDDIYGVESNLMSIKEVAKELGISRDRATVIAWGALKAMKIGGRYFVLHQDFDRYLKDVNWKKQHGKKG